MLFTILYIVMSMNRLNRKLWMLLNSLLDCFVQLKEKCTNILICVRFSGSVVYGKRLRQKIIMIIFRLFKVIYVTFANLTEQA